jgi:hypothetical protein
VAQFARASAFTRRLIERSVMSSIPKKKNGRSRTVRRPKEISMERFVPQKGAKFKARVAIGNLTNRFRDGGFQQQQLHRA